MTDYSSVFYNHKGNMSDKWEQYISMYGSELVEHISRGKAIKLLEIGVQNGGSLEVWRDFLPRGSTIMGIDIDPKVSGLSLGDNITVNVADATDASALEQIFGDSFFDVIVDDGSHVSIDIIRTFECCFNRLAPDGVYVIEDLHCSYYPYYGGGYRAAGAAIEYFKDLADAVNVDHIQNDDIVRIDPEKIKMLREIGRSIVRISFYDSAVVIRKARGTREKPYHRVLSGNKSTVATFEDYAKHLPVEHLENLLLTPNAAQQFSSYLIKRISEMRNDQEKLISDRTEMASARAAAEAKLHASEMEVQRLLGLVEHQQERSERLAIRMQENRARRRDAEEKVRSIEVKLSELENSTIWKLGAPLRALIDLMPTQIGQLLRACAKNLFSRGPNGSKGS